MNERVFDLPGRGTGGASEAVVAMGERRGYTVGAVGPGTFRLERAERPMWATALAIVTMPVLGIGLLFLRVRRHESAVVTIYEDRTGTKARIIGTLDDAIVDHLVTMPSDTVGAGAPAALSTDLTSSSRRSSALTIDDPIRAVPGIAARQGTESMTPASPTVEALPHEPTVGEWATVARPQRATVEASLESLMWTLVLPDGSRRILLSTVVVGRRPSVDDGQAPLAIDDLSLSKSHLRIEPVAMGVRVTDLHSTNGTIIRVNGSTSACPTGRPVVAPDGSVIVAGAVEIQVRQGDR